MDFGTPEFWVALLQIIGVNIVLSGDNAVVIALAARSLPPHQQKKAVFWGSGAAVVMRIVLTIVAVQLLQLPWLKLVGAVLLLWIALQLLMPEDEDEGHGEANTNLAAAIKTILIADLVMSLDNVIAVAAAAKGSLSLLIIGLAISIPLVIFASQILLVLMGRYPIIITLGAALLGWVAGEMAITDPVVKAWVDDQAAWLHWVAPAACALAVVAVGKVLAARQTAAADAALAAQPVHAPVAGSVLLASDGSSGALAAARHVVAMRPAPAVLHLLNVQPPLAGDASAAMPPGSVAAYHHERSTEDLAGVRALLDAAGLRYEVHEAVGDAAHEIAAQAKALGCTQVVLGTHGRGAATALVMGSVAREATRLCSVPVLTVKAEG